MVLETSAASLSASDELLAVHSPSVQNKSTCGDSCGDTDVEYEDLEPEVYLLSCAEVVYEKRDDTHGVSYCDSSSKYQWTPVVGRRRKKTPLPNYVLQWLPLHCWQELQIVSSDSESSGSDQPLEIPEKASVKFTVYEGKPGLQVKTRNTSNWTPIASRTRAKLKE